MTYFIDIFISGESLDTLAEEKLKYNIQNNDISEVKDRQASYSNVYEVPKTPKNKRLLGGLSLPSDTSQIPYTKPECQLKISGFSFILKGWFSVQDAGDSYRISIYSGIIDFFKSLENKTIGDIIGNDLDHVKDLATVVASFTNENYRYLIADYNGVTHYLSGADNVINIDYLVPSARVQYLWDKIHSYSNTTYTGSVFESEAFTNLWLTYPKSIESGELEEPVADASGNRTVSLIGHDGSVRPTYDKIVFQAGTGITSQTYFKAPQTAKYNIKMKIGTALIRSTPLNTPLRHTDSFYYYTINQENIPLDQRANKVQFSKRIFGVDGSNPSPGVWQDEFNVELIVELNQNDEISFFTYASTDQLFTWLLVVEKIEIAPYIPGGGTFSEELKSLEAVDFFKEVLNQLGLTPYTDEYSEEIRYKTINERLIDAPVLDWSDKYIKRKNESYVHSSYAQNNRFKYQYNDKEAEFNNSGLLINNPNLSAYKDVFVSKTYSPDKELTDFYIGSAGSRLTNVFRIYDKSVKESSDGSAASIEYKGLDKRFHFVRSLPITTNVKIGSQLFDDITDVTSIPMATFTRLDWKTLLEDNYLEMGRIMNDSRLHEINLKLNPIDILNLDLFCLIYFTQEQQYYLINKLSYNGNPVASGTFVRVKRETDQSAQFYIRISWIDGSEEDRSGMESAQDVKLLSITPPAQNINAVYEWEINSGSGFVSLGAGVTPKTINFPTAGIYEIRYKSIVAGMIYYSNVLKYTKTSASLFITDINRDNMGNTTYKLHVENQTFVGYANTRVDAQVNVKQTLLTVSPYGDNVSVINPSSLPAHNEKSQAVTIPVGIYDCSIDLSLIALNINNYAEAQGLVSYGTSPALDSGIAEASALSVYEP